MYVSEKYYPSGRKGKRKKDRDREREREQKI
jgi:hypothetical protein